MAAGSKWLLLGLCALVSALILASVLDYLGLGGAPWYGWWEGLVSPSTQPYTAAFRSSVPDGAVARAGIRTGDWIDVREQSPDVRLRLFAQPMAKRPITLVIHRGVRTFTTQVFPRTIWEGDVRLKLWTTVPAFVAGTWLLACALLISLRRASTSEGRILALILLLEAVPGFIIVPDSTATVLFSVAAYACGLLALLLVVVLSSRFGVPMKGRRIAEGCAYALFVLNAAALIAFWHGLFTLRIDPLKYNPNYNVGIFVPWLTSALSAGLAASVAVAAVAAVASTARSERPRVAWLLLPLPLALLATNAITGLQALIQSYAVTQVVYVLSECALLVGAITVTYALLKRRVLDFEFVLGRTIVVAIVSFIVVASFVLLEWLLGTVLVGVSHVTGLLANAGLALVLGLSMNVIHRRIDAAVDAILFRKRHDDERALLNFSKEASYVTEPEALLDGAIAKIQSHTDTRNAAIVLDDSGTFKAVRSFGADVFPVDENDDAILALKAWHKPLDPHQYATALKGALALPMVARGRLLGVLLLGERAGGEAYAPDEVEALSQFAYGVGSALDALSFNDGNSIEALRESMRESMSALAEAMASLPRAIAAELRDSAVQ